MHAPSLTCITICISLVILAGLSHDDYSPLLEGRAGKLLEHVLPLGLGVRRAAYRMVSPSHRIIHTCISCIYVCVYIYILLYISLCVYIYIYICICVYTYRCVHVYICVCIYIYIYIHIYIYTHTHMFMHTHMHIYIYIERERDRDIYLIERDTYIYIYYIYVSIALSLSLSLYIYIYIYTQSRCMLHRCSCRSTRLPSTIGALSDGTNYACGRGPSPKPPRRCIRWDAR